MTILAMPDDEDEGGAPSFGDDSHAQGQAAKARMDLPLEAYLPWPWRALNALMGPMAPGEVHYLAAASSVGKTTFVTSFVDLVAEQHPLYVIPTELPPQDWRVWWTCFRCRVKPRWVLQGWLKARAQGVELPDMPADVLALSQVDATRLRVQLRQTNAELSDPTGKWADRVYVSALKTLNGASVRASLKDAADFGAKCVLVDHVDQLRDKRNVFQAAGEVAEALMHGAQAHGLIVLATSQLNREATKGDHLARFRPPRGDTVRYGDEKFQNATTMLGLFRPPRLRHPHETPDEFKQQVRLAKENAIPAHDVLMPGVTGVSAMKFRLEGEAIGQKAYLGWQNGRLTDLTDAQSRDLQAAQHAIRTSEG